MSYQACPNCGYCPHCGRSAQPYWPYARPYYWPPYYNGNPYSWTAQGLTGTATSGNVSWESQLQAALGPKQT